MSISRRSFLLVGVAALASASAISRLGSLGEAYAAGAELPLPKETDEPAKSLKYCANGDKPSKNCAGRSAKDKKDQYCYNCQLFTKASGEGKSAKGKCMIMPKNSVGGSAWCQSWVKNPAIT